MILFYDTETTGFPKPNSPHDDERQPHLVQLAALLTEDDGVERASINLIVRPDGWEIPADTAELHGINTALALRAGVSEAMVFASWDRLAALAHTHVAHNIKFDDMMMHITGARTRIARSKATLEGQKFCTMEASTRIVNLPPTERMRAKGMTAPKPPKLSECVRHFFNEDLIGAHDAMVDVRACARVYFHLKTLKRAA